MYYNAEQIYNVFILLLSRFYDNYLPFVLNKSKRTNIPKPWVTGYLLRSIEKKYRLYKTFIRNRSYRNEHKLKSYRNIVNNS